MQKLPLGIQTFRELREENYLYVDKTEYMYKLVTEGKNYFLSRPRRFGKSLTISTLETLFKGEKDLFKDLYIYDKEWEWKKWPILHFDFSELSEEQNPEDLKILIKQTLDVTIREFQLEIPPELPYNMYFRSILKQLPEKAVILIDEYDKPILDNINNPEKATRMKEILKGFYSIIKSADSNVKFTFLTGVSKFAKISVFSGLNNLKDLTMKPDYAAICGYTEEEIDKYFFKSLSTIANELKIETSELRNKIREWYNGFRFTQKNRTVYNPLSILNFIEDKEFNSYWFETSTPTYLTDLLKKEGFTPDKLEEYLSPVHEFSTYDVERIRALPILFQTGYLTIKDYQAYRKAYVLGFPNKEVKSSFIDSLLTEYIVSATGTTQTPLFNLDDALRSNDLEAFFENIKILFAKVPYDIHLKYEKYWQSLFYMIFTLMGYFIEVEYRTNRGRIDALINMENKVYLFEFKFTEKNDGSKMLEEAETQIRETKYARRFLDSDKPVYLIPAVFDYADNKAVILWKKLTE